MARTHTPMRVNTCRFCGKRAHSDWLVKYGTRAYACFECYSANKTMQDIAALSQFERHKFEDWQDIRAARKQVADECSIGSPDCDPHCDGRKCLESVEPPVPGGWQR